MARVNLIKCDGPNCDKKIDLEQIGTGSYHHLSLGGSDFDMSFNFQRDFDFCSHECLKEWLEKEIRKMEEE